MKITINTRTVFLFPTGLITNRFTAGIISRNLKKEGVRLTKKQTSLFIKEIIRYKKNHADWNLVEFESKNGDMVEVKI
ncbi:MAG: hypothetical protein IKT44_02685 [Clostridia bacterium]|nr:hypothetical protein [Clostridia bacterium]